MVHQQTAAQSTTRLVYEAYTQVTPDYMTGLENSELARGTNPGICNGEIRDLQWGDPLSPRGGSHASEIIC